ncbi:YAP1-binding protein 1 [Monosporozyma servazzii]
MNISSKNELIGNLKKAFNDHNEDPVSLVTIIDLYATQFDNEGSREDIVDYLTVLYQLLKTNENVVHEIGWDLPKVLLDLFNEKNIDLDSKLTENGIITLVMRCFDEISRLGNPKECLLTGCDLLSTLSFDPDLDEEITDEAIYGSETRNDDKEDKIGVPTQKPKAEEGNFQKPTATQTEQEIFIAKSSTDFIPNLKVHVIFQLLGSTLKRVKTIYPSKFLGMVISSILAFLKKNIDTIEDPSFVLHRIYTLTINYQPIILPYGDDIDISEDDYKEVVADEHDLSLKLLQEFITLVLSMSYKRKELNFDVIYYVSLTGKSVDMDLYEDGFEKLCNQFLELSDKFDINIKDQFFKILNEAEKIYEPILNQSSSSSESDMNQMVYQLAYTYNMKKALETKNLQLNPQGTILLSAFYYLQNKKSVIPEIDIQKVIYLYLACSTTSLYSPMYDNKGLDSVCRYWLWVSVTERPVAALKLKLKEMGPVIIKVFLQMLLVKTCANTGEHIRGISFILLTRILCLIPEDISYDFIFDTLLTCPYGNAKTTILKILKDLMTKNSGIFTDSTGKAEVTSVTAHMKELNVDDVSKPPSLPPRPYIGITDDRMAAIHSLAVMSIEKITTELESGNKSSISLTLSYMNFLVGLRNRWNKDLLHVINEKVEGMVLSQVSSTQKEEIPELQFIALANDTLSDFLEA